MVARAQLCERGLSEEGIAQATASGRLYPVFWSTYAVGHRSLGLHGRLMAATLACGDGTVVSHGSAAWLLGLWEAKPAEVEVIAPVEAGRKIGGIRRRFVPSPPKSQMVALHRIPCTSPSRTVVDLAGLCSASTLEAVVEQAAVLRVLDVPAIDEILSEGRRRGSQRLNRVLESWRRYSPRARIRSRMEAKMLPFLTHHSLPIPETNVKLRADRKAFEVDFLWREERVVVETDGGRFHDNPPAEARDSQRNQALARAGYRVPRIGWEELRDEPERVIAEIRRFLRPPDSPVP